MASASSSNTEEVVTLLIYGFFLSKPTERAVVLQYLEDPAKETDLEDISILSRIISNPIRNEINSGTRGQLMAKCLELVKSYLMKLEKVIPGCNGSYCSVTKYLSLITSSPYAELYGLGFDYIYAKTGVFLDFENFDKPNPVTDIRANIERWLESKGFLGKVEIFPIGDITTRFNESELEIIRDQRIEVLHTKKGCSTAKDTADKRLIAKMVHWAFTHSRESREPGNILLSTSDVGFLSAVEKVKTKGFQVFLAHNDRTLHDNDKTIFVDGSGVEL